MKNKKIVNLANPTDNEDAANKMLMKKQEQSIFSLFCQTDHNSNSEVHHQNKFVTAYRLFCNSCNIGSVCVGELHKNSSESFHEGLIVNSDCHTLLIYKDTVFTKTNQGTPRLFCEKIHY